MDHFSPFYPNIDPKNKYLEKMWKNPGDILLHMCTTNEDHMIYGSWDIRHNRVTLWPSYQPEKSKFSKNEKHTLIYHHFTLLYYKWQLHDVRFLRNGVWQTKFIVILGHFLPFYPTKNPKIKILKKWKESLEIPSFYKSVP